MRLKEVFDELQKSIDNLPDKNVRKVYVAACISTACTITNKTDPHANVIELDFDQAYNDIQEFKLRNEL